MITVTTTTSDRVEYPTAARFLTEDVFNNLCLHDDKDNLLAVYAQDQWISVEVNDGQA